MEKSYNSLVLLGEFYSLLRIAEQPIGILGQSLIQLLSQELEEVLQGRGVLRASLGKLVLTQVTLNGFLLKKFELAKFNNLLDTIRQTIMESDGNRRCGRAYLMYALDLYYNNFTANAAITLQKFYGRYLDEPEVPAINHFDDNTTTTATTITTESVHVQTSGDDQHVPEKRQRVEMAVQTEVAIADVFRAGPAILSPIERAASTATTFTNISISRGDESSKTGTPPSPSRTVATNSTGTCKSKIDPRIRNVRIGRVYPNPKSTTSSSPRTPISPPRPLRTSTMSSDTSLNMENGNEVAKLSIKNVTLHELAMMKENPSHLNRITNGYLDRLSPPSEIRCPSIKSTNEYTGKENDSERESLRNGQGSTQKKSSPSHSGSVSSKNNAMKNNSKFRMEENFDTITYDPSFFDDYVPNNNSSRSKSFLQFLNK